MVVFVDLDEENEPPEDIRMRNHWDVHGQVLNNGRFPGSVTEETESKKSAEPEATKMREKQSRTAIAIAEAMGCYPYVLNTDPQIE